MAPQRCSTIQEEVQHYEAEVAERQKSLQEMKAGREWPKSCENSRHVRGDFGLAGKELIMSNSCGIWKMLRETVSQHGEGHGESKILHWYSQVLWLNFLISISFVWLDFVSFCFVVYSESSAGCHYTQSVPGRVLLRTEGCRSRSPTQKSRILMVQWLTNGRWKEDPKPFPASWSHKKTRLGNCAL